jgi:hypothetical protein
MHSVAGDESGEPVLYRHFPAKLNRLGVVTPPARAYSVGSVRSERLPFRVRVVNSPQDLDKAVEVRASAYERHMPSLGQRLKLPEAEDLKPDVLVLLAERKFDSQPLGSLRLQSNLKRPLRLQGEAPPLAEFARFRLVETTRLGVALGETSRVVTAALIKTAFEICHATEVDYSVTGGRRSMAQIFRSLQFDEISGGPFPISFGNDIPHWIFVLPIRKFESRLRMAGHWYYEFMARTEHPDIGVDWEYVRSAFAPQ